MLNDRFFVILGAMMIVPTVCILLNVDPGTATLATMATNLGLLFYIRKTFRNNITGLLGGKIKFQCLVCSGTKFDKKGTCWKCGSRARKSI